MDRIGGPDAEAVLRLLRKLAEGSPTAALKGKQLLDLSSDVQECCAARNTPTEPDLRREHFLLACVATGGLLLLLSKVLLSRKRVRDWRQQQYSSRVCSLLRAATAALKLLHSTRQGGQLQYQCSIPDAAEVAAAELDRAGTIGAVAAAQAEVAQLLSACRQQQQPEGLPQLQQLAAELLAFWLEAHMLWLTHGDLSAGGPAGPAAFLQPAVDLAAVLAQTLTARSPGAQFVLVAQVAYRSCQVGVPHGSSNEAYAARLAMWDSPAQLQLSVAIQVLHSYCLQNSSSASGSAAETEAAGAAAVGKPDAAAIEAKTLELLPGMQISLDTAMREVVLAVQAATGWVLDTEADLAAVEAACSIHGLQQEAGELLGAPLCEKARAAWNQLQQRQQGGQQQLLLQEQLAAVTLQAWEAAGMAADALPAFAAAVRQHLAAPQPHRPGTATLKASTPREFAHVTQWTASCVHACFEQQIKPNPCAAPPPTALATRAVEQLSRHQQQLLQHLVWPLPQLLLQTAVLHDDRCGAIRSEAVSAAARIVAVWQLPGLYAAAVDASAASAGSGSSRARQNSRPLPAAAAAAAVQPLQQHLVPLLDCWLLLMQQVLLQPHMGLVWQAAAPVPVVPDSNLEHMLLTQEQCDCHNSFIPPCCAAGSCGAAQAATAARGTDARDQRKLVTGNSWSSAVFLSCREADAAACLVALLQQLGGLHGPSLVLSGSRAALGSSGSISAQSAAAADAIRAAWRSKGAAVMLVLESLMRHVLPHHGLCLGSQVQARASQPCSSGEGQGDVSSEVRCSNTVATLRARLSECLRLDGILQADQKQQQQQQQQGVLAQLWSAALGDGGQQLQVRLCALHVSAFKLTQHQPGQTVGAAIAAASSWLQGAAAAATAAAAAACGGTSEAAGDAAAAASTAAKAVGAVMAGTAGADPAAEESCRVAVFWLVLMGHATQQMGGVLYAVLHSLTAPVPGEQGTLAPREQGAPPAGWVGDEGVQAILEACRAAVGAVNAGSAQAMTHLATALRPLLVLGGSSDAGVPTGSGSSHGDGSGSGASVSSVSQAAAATTVIASWSQVWVSAAALGMLLGRGLEVCGAAAAAQQSLQQQGAAPPAHGRQLLAELQQRSCLRVLPERLQQLGDLLCGLLPVPWCCNNSRCLAMTGVSELQLVGGKACVCGGCMVARYCSRACQAEAAEQHRPICKQLAAARRLSEAAAAAPKQS